jgi:hypothetical protein
MEFPQEIWSIIKMYFLEDTEYFFGVFEKDYGDILPIPFKLGMFYQVKHNFGQYVSDWFQMGDSIDSALYADISRIYTSGFKMDEMWKSMDECKGRERPTKLFLAEMKRQRYEQHDTIDNHSFYGFFESKTDWRKFIRTDISILIREKQVANGTRVYLFLSNDIAFDRNYIFKTSRGTPTHISPLRMEKLEDMSMLDRYDQHFKDFVDICVVYPHTQN